MRRLRALAAAACPAAAVGAAPWRCAALVAAAPAAPHRPPPAARRAFSAPPAAEDAPLLSELDRLRMVHDLTHIKRAQIPAHPGVQRAAVLVPFCHVAGRPSVLFTLRGGADGLLPPDVGFPGGRPEATPLPPATSAVRQACHELGLLKQCVSVLGLHHDVPDVRTRVVLTPVLAYLGELHAAQLRPRGGAAARGAFSLTLDALLAPGSLVFEPPPGLSYDDVAGAGAPPLPVFNARGGDRRITGATAAALHAALRVALGQRSGAARDALYGPLLAAAAAARREQRG